jgi:hypothetical protein
METNFALPPINSPYVSIEKFAADSGQTERAVKSDIDLGRIPIIKFGRGGKRLINVALMFRDAYAQSSEESPWDAHAQTSQL